MFRTWNNRWLNHVSSFLIALISRVSRDIIKRILLRDQNSRPHFRICNDANMIVYVARRSRYVTGVKRDYFRELWSRLVHLSLSKWASYLYLCRSRWVVPMLNIALRGINRLQRYWSPSYTFVRPFGITVTSAFRTCEACMQSEEYRVCSPRLVEYQRHFLEMGQKPSKPK